MKRTAAGFTLVELMITVVIVAILTSIAVPSYRSYVVRNNRTVAKTALVEMASRQESFYTDRKRYAATLSALGYPADTVFVTRDSRLLAAVSSEAIYQIIMPVIATSRFTLSAVPVGSQASDTSCGQLSLSFDGTKAATGSSGLECWKK